MGYIESTQQGGAILTKQSRSPKIWRTQGPYLFSELDSYGALPLLREKGGKAHRRRRYGFLTGTRGQWAGVESTMP